MQRRAVAVYVALFVLIGVASYTLMATAEQPQVTVDNPDFQLSSGDEFTIDGQSYTAATVEEVTEEGGHGSTSTHMAATIEWTLAGVENTDEWAVGDTITVDEREWEVMGTTDSTVTVENVIDREAILEADPAADNQTYSGEDGDFVRVSGETVPVSEYFDPDEVTFSEGETVSYDGQQATVDSVTNESVTVYWTTEASKRQELGTGDTVTIGDQHNYPR